MDGSSKPTLALLPGLLCDGALWSAQVEALSDLADCRVANFTSQDSIAAMADSVLREMPARFALAGLSMGGYVALEIMATVPERVTRLALIDTRARADTPEERSRRRGLIELAEKGQFKGVTPRLLPLFLHESRLAEEDGLPAEVADMAMRIGKDAFVRQQRAIIGRADRRGTLAAIDCPALLLCGRQDQLTPPDLHAEMALAIGDARLIVLDDCGHLAPLERPEAVNRAMRAWLLEA